MDKSHFRHLVGLELINGHQKHNMPTHASLWHHIILNEWENIYVYKENHPDRKIENLITDEIQCFELWGYKKDDLQWNCPSVSLILSSMTEVKKIHCIKIQCQEKKQF